MSKLERSQLYFRKVQLCREKKVPTQTEVKCRLGDDLAQLLFRSEDPAIRSYLGCECVLEGAGEQLWISPSDCLIGTVRLKPPLTSKHIQALAHQGILEIGSGIEGTFQRQLDEQIRIALLANTERWRYNRAKAVQRAIEATKNEEQARHLTEIALLNAEFEVQLGEELERLRAEMGAQKDVEVLEGKLEMKKLMQRKVEEVVRITISRLIEEYSQILQQQSVKWHEHFNFHLKLAEERLDAAVENERIRSNKEFKSMYTELQCDFIANMMYVTCTERRHCELEKKETLKFHESKIETLNATLAVTQAQLAEANRIVRQKTKRLVSQEQVLFNIIQEFQKFVYFVLRAEPKQAEYLLNVEKLMIFELTKTVMEKRPGWFVDDSVFNAEKVGSGSSTEPSEMSYESDSLSLKDYHDCRNYERVHRSAHTLCSDDSEDFPAFRFNENVFIREDFRNMISQGLRISKSNHYWNWDIDDLQRFLLTDHGACLRDRPSDEFDCLDKVESNLQFKSTFFYPCHGICEMQPPAPRLNQVPSEFFHSTCSLMCEGNLTTHHASLDMEVAMSRTSQDVDVQWQIESPTVPSDEAIVKPADSFERLHLAGSCEECDILGPKSLDQTDKVVCECLPKVSAPSFNEVLEMSKAFADRIIETNEPASRTSVGEFPVNFAEDSHELIRKSIGKKAGFESTLSLSSRSLSVKSSGSKRLVFHRRESNLVAVRDSIELFHAQQRPSNSNTSCSVSTLSGNSSFEMFTSFVDKLRDRESHVKVKHKGSSEKTVKISHFQIIDPPKKESVIVKTLPTKIHDWASSPTIQPAKVPLAPHTDERVDSFVRNISSDRKLIQMFLGS